MSRFDIMAAGALLLCMHVGAAAQPEEARALKVGKGDGQSARPLGLRAEFDRPDPTYAVGDQLGLLIATDHDASIEIWDLAPDGSLTRLLPNMALATGPGKPLRLPMRGQRFEVGEAVGLSELHIIARAESNARSVTRADARRPGSDRRQELRLRYRVVAR